MDFIIDDHSPRALSGVIKAVIEKCEELKDGKLLTTYSLMERINYSYSHLMRQTKNKMLEPYMVMALYQNSRQMLWGNPKTIKAYKELLHDKKEK